MKVGLLTTSFPRYTGDIAGSFVLGFARALNEHGHSVEVLAPEPRERSVSALQQRAVSAYKQREGCDSLRGPGDRDRPLRERSELLLSELRKRTTGLRAIEHQHATPLGGTSEARDPLLHDLLHAARAPRDVLLDELRRAARDPSDVPLHGLLHAGGDPLGGLSATHHEPRGCEAASVAGTKPGIALHYVPYLRPRALQRTFYGAGVPDNLARDPLAWLGLAPFCASLGYQAWKRRADWDAIVSHWALPCALAAAAIRDGRRHIAVLHSADIHVLSRLPGRTQLAAAIARGADALWFVSDAQRERFHALLPHDAPLPRSLVCPMGIDVSARDVFDGDTRAEFRRRHQLQGFCVLLLGRHIPIKGYDVALRAAALGGDITLLIAGDGPMRNAWMRQAQALGVRVRWLGPVHGDDKQRWLRAADAFALPSRTLSSGRSEGLPCALLEALEAGLPAVASDLPGIRELQATIAPSLVLVPADDPLALHTSLLTLRNKTQTDERHEQTARAIREHFSWRGIGARLHALLAPS